MIERGMLLFPPSPRVIYRQTPLVEVICQVRFPSLLSISSQPPVEFQERIRDQFPLLQRVPAQLPMDVPAEFAQLIGQQFLGSTYQFQTEDNRYAITLTAESLALTTSKYIRWEHFWSHFDGPFRALNKIYRPNFFSRIGLRYRDAIDPTHLGLADAAWSDLLRRELLGELVLPTFAQSVQDIANRTLKLRIPDGSGSVLLRHGLGTLEGRANPGYMIDFDFFTEKRTEAANVQPTLDQFNAMAGNAFRWCITDRLRDALGPCALEDTPE